MTSPVIALVTYLIHKYLGEFKLAKHPLDLIGDVSEFYNEKFYRDTWLRGLMLILFVTAFVLVVGISIYEYLSIMHPFFNILISSLIASLFLSYGSVYTALRSLIDGGDKKAVLSDLTGEETGQMSESDLYKTAITKYARSINTDLIAPLFYLALLGLPALMFYMSVVLLHENNKKGNEYTKTITLLYNTVQFVPSRISAMVVSMLFEKKGSLTKLASPIEAFSAALALKLAPAQEGKEIAVPSDLVKALFIEEKLQKTVAIALAAGAFVAAGMSWIM